MNQSKLVLADGTKINLEDGASIGNMCVVSANKTAMLDTWVKLTPDNLRQVQITTDGEVSGQYSNLILDHETSTVQGNGSILTSFALRQKTQIELLQEEVAELRAGQSIQDGAIADLGAITSAVVEKVEGGIQ